MQIQSNVLNLSDKIHVRALELSQNYRILEAELIEVLQAADRHRVYIQKGQSSLFQYVVKVLGLSESVAYNLITVSRKAREVPELKSAIQSGAVTLSNARKITPILTSANKTEWLQKAATLSNRELEKEMVKAYPKSATPERVSYVTESRLRLDIGLPESEMLKLRKVQDLLSQTKRRSLSLEEVLIELSNEYLNRNDPVVKAKRILVSAKLVTKKGNGIEAGDLVQTDAVKPVTLQASKSPLLRAAIPAKILHQVNLRDQRHCTHINELGIRCNQSRFVEIHHKIPVSMGGQNTLTNLITLCSSHHQFVHLETIQN